MAATQEIVEHPIHYRRDDDDDHDEKETEQYEQQEQAEMPLTEYYSNKLGQGEQSLEGSCMENEN